MADHWYLLDRLEALVGDLGNPVGADQAGRVLVPLAANLADTLSSPGNRGEIADGAQRAASLLDRIRAVHELDETSPAFMAGRLATVVDTLALLVRVCAPDELVEQAKLELETLQALYTGPLSNVEIADIRGTGEEVACRSLRTCRELDLVETERKGRLNVNRLTRLAQGLFDDGLLPANDKATYDMRRVVRITKARDLRKGPGLPQISVGP